MIPSNLSAETPNFGGLTADRKVSSNPSIIPLIPNSYKNLTTGIIIGKNTVLLHDDGYEQMDHNDGTHYNEERKIDVLVPKPAIIPFQNIQISPGSSSNNSS